MRQKDPISNSLTISGYKFSCGSTDGPASATHARPYNRQPAQGESCEFCAGSLRHRHDTEALRLVRQAADLLRSTKDHSAEIEAQAQAFADRAVAELKEARERIQSLESDCERLGSLLADTKDQAYAAKRALKQSVARLAAMELSCQPLKNAHDLLSTARPRRKACSCGSRMQSGLRFWNRCALLRSPLRLSK